MDNCYQLFTSTLKGMRQIGGANQYIAQCPFHQDNKPSFSLNTEKFIWNCKSCGVQGNAYQYAERLGLPEPHQYIESNGADYSTIPPPPKKPTISKEELKSDIEKYKNNLKGSDKYPKYWDESLIDELGIGLNGDDIVFGYYDSEGELKGYKIHKKWTKGDASVHWYPSHKFKEYEVFKPLYIVEGEKDVITLISQGLQAITTTAGALSIPKGDYDYISSFEQLFICYDNDETGGKGNLKCANEIMLKHPHQDIKIIQWDSELPKGFDVTDSYINDGGGEFFNALAHGRLCRSMKPNPNEFGGLKLIRENDAINMEIKPRRQIIEQILPEHAQVILGGTTGANKSFMAMDMGMSIANDEDEFFGKKLNVKGLSVLFVDTEIGADSLVERFQNVKDRNYKNWKENNRFNLVSKEGNSINIYDDIEKVIETLQPNVVIIDCLYNTTDGSDITKNHNMFPILQRITEIKDKYKCTMVAVHHSNKGGHEQGLVSDRLAGGSALQNWAEQIIMLSKTNEDEIRLFKIDKSRHFSYSQAYYLIEWDSDKLKLINRGITNDWKKYLIHDSKKIKWENALDEMKDEFTSGEFRIAVAVGGDASERTASNWLKEMAIVGVIEKTIYGHYRKNLGVFSDVE